MKLLKSNPKIILKSVHPFATLSAIPIYTNATDNRDSRMKCLMNAWNHAEPGFYDWLLKQTQNPHEAEDIMQEVFLKAMGNSERFCTLQEGKSWLFKMTRNHLVELLRRKIHSVGIEEFVMPIDISL